jgi:hypothetical protein
LVAWSQENAPGPSVTALQMYDQHEPKIGPAIIKGEQLGNQALPAVAGNLHGSFLVFRQVDFAAGQQIWAMHCFVESNSPYCLDSFPVEDYSFWDGKHPAVANGGMSPKDNTFLIVYEEPAPGDLSVQQRIYGRIYSAYQWTFLPMIRR